MVPEEHQGQLEKLLEIFLEENKNINLSALRTKQLCWTGNVLDSLAFLEVCSKFSLTPNPSLKGRGGPPSPSGGRVGDGGGNSEQYKRNKPVPKNLLHFARNMRKNSTKAEEILWNALRDKSLDTRFRRQHPICGFILDLYCHEYLLGIEVDGESHQTKEQKKNDQERTAYLMEEHGITIIRFSNHDVLHNLSSVLQTIQKHIHTHSTSPEERGLGGEEGMKILDIGTGGGFPLLPLAICLPNIQCTGLDSTQKKLDAIGRIAQTLKLDNVQLVHGRTEELGHQSEFREQFTVVTARAVAPLNTLLEYAAPFVKTGGYIVAWKSLHIEQEMQDSLAARSLMHCHLDSHYEYTLPDDFGTRQLLIFQKTTDTPNTYPRAVGIPKKDPIS